jgi:putative transposase
MFSIKRELKLNNKQKSYLSGCAGYARFVYNMGLAMIKESWNFEGIKASDSKRLNEIKKVFTNHVKTLPEYAWMNNYSSRIYQNAFMALSKAFSNWRKGIAKMPQLALSKAFSNWRKGIAKMPQFKKKRHECSFTVDSSNGKVLVKEGKTIKIPTLGTFKLKEAIPFNCVSQTFAISCSGGKWYVSFSEEAEVGITGAVFGYAVPPKLIETFYSSLI